MNIRPLYMTLPVLLILALSALPASAQSFSYDGNRWYEIEVSIFTNIVTAGNSEQVKPEAVTLEYLRPNRQLVPAVSSFMIPFAEEGVLPGDPFRQDESPVPQTGPAPAPGPGGFKVADFTRDPFIALGSGQARFTRYNANISRSPEHRLLYHAVWRQPVLNRVQATAITVIAGDRYGSHNELEGSLRFSYDVNRVDVEARLWLSTFRRSAGAIGQWRLPPQPAAEQDNATEEYIVASLAYLDQERAMVSNDLHYIDHPAMGILVEIRPYQLPEPASLPFD